MTTYTTKMFDRLDRICFDHYGSTARRHVETVLDANPGLERQPILLPVGLTLALPDAVVEPAVRTARQIKLYQ